jgi:hypothetical protein
MHRYACGPTPTTARCQLAVAEPVGCVRVRLRLPEGPRRLRGTAASIGGAARINLHALTAEPAHVMGCDARRRVFTQGYQPRARPNSTTPCCAVRQQRVVSAASRHSLNRHRPCRATSRRHSTMTAGFRLQPACLRALYLGSHNSTTAISVFPGLAHLIGAAPNSAQSSRRSERLSRNERFQGPVGMA